MFPDEKLRLEVPADPTNMTARIVDLVSPIGKGQRGLIVSPPKAGKTTVMKQIARSIETNNPEVHLMVLLIDERPEEVTDMRRWVKGEVVASTFDRPSDEHTMVAELAIERAKRLVEDGQRRRHHPRRHHPSRPRLQPGGARHRPHHVRRHRHRRAVSAEEVLRCGPQHRRGRLAHHPRHRADRHRLKMDEVIFEEFKGTGNMELRLDRKLAERRIYPAIDVDASSTRHEELLFERKQLQMVWKLRRVLSGLGEGGGGAGLEMLIDRLARSRATTSSSPRSPRRRRM